MKKNIETLEVASNIETLNSPKKSNNIIIVVVVVITIICSLIFVGMKNLFKEDNEEQKEEIPVTDVVDEEEANDYEKVIDESEYGYKYYKCFTDSKENYYNSIKYNYYEMYAFLVRISDNNITPGTIRIYVTFDNEIDYNNFKKNNSIYIEDSNGINSLLFDTKITPFNNKIFDNSYISLLKSKNYVCENPSYVPDSDNHSKESILERLLK